MVAISSTLKEDLYVVYAGTNPDTNLPVIHAYLNPLVKWIWLGGVRCRSGNDSGAHSEPAGGARDVACDGRSRRADSRQRTACPGFDFCKIAVATG